MTDPWTTWKRGFDAWEQATAKFTEQLMSSPLLLEPSGAMLGAMMKARAEADRRAASWWSTVGLPTRHDQERMMQAFNLLHSGILPFVWVGAAAGGGAAEAENSAKK